MNNERRITFEVPLIFKLTLVNYGLGQTVFSVRILVLSFYIAICYGVGWAVGPDIGKWFCGLAIHLKRVIIGLHLGLELSVFLDWKTKQLIRRLSPAKIEQLIQILSRI